MKKECFKIFETKDGVGIFVSRGSKPQSNFDFRVHYQEPGKRMRTPKHIHLIIDLYMKLIGDEDLTMALVDHVIENIIKKVRPAREFPPKLQVFDPELVKKFEALDKYGEYSVEFILVVLELIMIQEKTNYPNGKLNLRLFEKFRKKESIFSVVNAATFRNRQFR